MNLSLHEVATQLRRALSGKVAITLADPAVTWNGKYCGDVVFNVGDWQITFFNDCDEMDYIDYAIAPDGRSGSCVDWVGMTDTEDERIFCPLDLLSLYEKNRLEQMLEEAR